MIGQIEIMKKKIQIQIPPISDFLQTLSKKVQNVKHVIISLRPKFLHWQKNLRPTLPSSSRQPLPSPQKLSKNEIQRQKVQPKI